MLLRQDLPPVNICLPAFYSPNFDSSIGWEWSCSAPLVSSHFFAVLPGTDVVMFEMKFTCGQYNESIQWAMYQLLKYWDTERKTLNWVLHGLTGLWLLLAMMSCLWPLPKLSFSYLADAALAVWTHVGVTFLFILFIFFIECLHTAEPAAFRAEDLPTEWFTSRFHLQFEFL